MKTIFVSIFLALTLPAVSFAQALPVDRLTPPFPTAGERKAADVASWITVVTAIGLDAQATVSRTNSPSELRRAAALAGLRDGTVYGSTFLLKKLFARERPCAPSCGLDNADFSFPSGHTAAAFAGVGGPSIYVALPLALGTGGLRVAAGKHYLTDTLAGAGIGLLASRIR